MLCGKISREEKSKSLELKEEGLKKIISLQGKMRIFSGKTQKDALSSQ